MASPSGFLPHQIVLLESHPDAAVLLVKDFSTASGDKNLYLDSLPSRSTKINCPLRIINCPSKSSWGILASRIWETFSKLIIGNIFVSTFMLLMLGSKFSLLLFEQKEMFLTND